LSDATRQDRTGPPYDAIVLAGGAGRRLGGTDKALLTVGGRTLLARAVSAVAGADSVVVVGPRRDVGLPREISWTREEPAGSGPPAALAAGAAIVGADLVVVLAVDTPLVGRPLVEMLVSQLTGSASGDAVMLVDADGYRQPLVAAYRRAALLTADRSPSLRELVAALDVIELTDTAGASRDVDTPADLAFLEARMRNGT
jgi:molybdopterin-guanine dinucleotide biosynthesis protein A